MNKVWVVVMFLVLPLIFTLQVNAQVVSSEAAKAEVLKKPRFSAEIGLGSSYRLSSRLSGVLSYYKSAFASSLRVGYSLSKYVKIQGEYSTSGEFKAKVVNAKSYQTAIRSFSPMSLNLKAGLPMITGKTKLFPYIVVGVGKAKTEYAGYYKSSVTEFTFGQKTKEPCTKIGIGIEADIHKNIYLFSEFNRWKADWINEFDQTRKVFFYNQVLVGVGMRFH